jgi:hypothetical protein
LETLNAARVGIICAINILDTTVQAQAQQRSCVLSARANGLEIDPGPAKTDNPECQCLSKCTTADRLKANTSLFFQTDHKAFKEEAQFPLKGARKYVEAGKDHKAKLRISTLQVQCVGRVQEMQSPSQRIQWKTDIY